jgi:hypothetical protein
MAETEALSSFGTVLQIGDGADPEVFTGIAEVRDIDGPGLELSTIEVTHHLSPDATREHMATLKDLTEISFEIAFIPTGATHDLTTGLMSVWYNRTKNNWRIVFTDSGSTTWQMSGFVTSFGLGAPVEGILTASCTIKLTGGITEV